MTPGQLERHLIPVERWSEAPTEAQKIANEQSAQGCPTGIARNPETGTYVVLQSSGQGPYIIWDGAEPV